MAEDGGNVSVVPDARGSEGRSSLPRTFIRLNDLSGVGGGGGERSEVMVELAAPAAPAPDGVSAAGEEASVCDEDALPYPTLAPVVFFYLKQTTRPRSWCLKMVCNPYPFTRELGVMRDAHAHMRALPPVAGKKHLFGCASLPVDLRGY